MRDFSQLCVHIFILFFRVIITYWRINQPGENSTSLKVPYEMTKIFLHAKIVFADETRKTVPFRCAQNLKQKDGLH